MNFLKKSCNWLAKEWRQKSFRIFIIINIVFVILLTYENIGLFSANVLRTLRHDALLASLAVIAWIDRQKKIIPNGILLFMVCIRLIFWVVEWIIAPDVGLAMLISAVMGALIGGGLFLLCYFITRASIGMGDVKLFCVIGLYVGSGVIMTVVFLSVVVSAVYSIVQLVRRKTKLKDEIPFAPFVWIGMILTMVIGM